MEKLFNLPHRTRPGLCPVNGIRDLVQWRTGRDWSNEFLWGLGQGGGFAYLRFSSANPPRQIYTGNATARQHRYLADLLGANLQETEGRTFKYSWDKARQALEAGTPPVLGPLDMFHLHYYDGIYHQQHIPIHYVLLVGCEGEKAYVLDTGEEGVQTISLDELQLAWEVNTPGLGKRNRVAFLDIPPVLPPTAVLIHRSIADECQTMLHPPVSMLGIPAMRKAAREIAHWPEELGADTTARCLLQVREYLSSPPGADGAHLTAGRNLYIAFLQEAGEMAGLDFSTAIGWLCESMAIIPRLAGAIDRNDLEQAAACFNRMADSETNAYIELSKVITQ